MKKQTSKINWELFDGNSSTQEAMYFWLFGKYGFDGFEEYGISWWSDDEIIAKEIKQMRKMGIKSARKDCEKWLKKEYGAEHLKEVKDDYCTCDHCPIHGKDDQ